ncbi:MAG: 1-acyl-sn-glycerol-3-phosphate acyltransferase [Hyphomicrobiales bacterium]|nr:1-acyl-sn-glycerol-3-phosphate acyltransferase [Hyphomicrobiales bacterium]
MAPIRGLIQSIWSSVSRWSTGLHVRVLGEPVRGRCVLFVSNHVSYLDIPVLSGELEASFVAKTEVSSWPLFGLIAKLTNTVFVNRTSRDAAAQRQELSQRLEQGESLILFPEGTSTDGSTVAPFKSSLFSVVHHAAGAGQTAIIQPISITYVRTIDGTPLVGSRRSLYCWFGDDTFFPHLMRVLSLKGVEVELRFHPPLSIGEKPDRKDLARRAHAIVSAGNAAAQGQLAADAPEDCVNEAPPVIFDAKDQAEPAYR